jgi:hypothetical protein
LYLDITMAPITDASLAAGRALVRRAADALPHLMAREKPVDTKKMTGIIIGVVLYGLPNI